MTAARPAKPSASQPGWARRARAAYSATPSGATTGTLAITFPVAGFSTSIAAGFPAPFDAVLLGTVVVSVTSLLRSSLSESYPVAGALLAQKRCDSQRGATAHRHRAGAPAAPGRDRPHEPLRVKQGDRVAGHLVRGQEPRPGPVDRRGRRVV